jgi:hypothetical protein
MGVSCVIEAWKVSRFLARNGRAVQVDPMKLTFKASGSKRLTLKHGELLSNIAFDFNLRYYTTARSTACWAWARRPR